MSSHSASSVVVLISVALVCFFASTLGASAISTDLILPTRHTETHKALIEEVNPDEHLNKTQAAAVAAIKKSIHDHIVNLYKEEERLVHLMRERDTLKKGWWFFHADQRHIVEEAQVKVNNQRREIEKQLEHIELEWRHLKPFYGLYSKLFLSELTVRLVRWISTVIDSFFALFALELMMLLIVSGPLALFFSMLWFASGWSLFTTMLKLSLIVLTIYWIFTLPSIMIQYQPTITEFGLVYTVVIGVLSLFTAWIWGVFPSVRRGSRSHQQQQTRTKRD